MGRFFGGAASGAIRGVLRVAAATVLAAAGTTVAACGSFDGDPTKEAREELASWAATQPELAELTFEAQNVPLPSSYIKVRGPVGVGTAEGFLRAVDKLEAKEDELKGRTSLKFAALDMYLEAQLGATRLEWVRRVTPDPGYRDFGPLIQPAASRVIVDRPRRVTVTRNEEVDDGQARAYLEETAMPSEQPAEETRVSYHGFPFGPWTPSVLLYQGQLPLADAVVAAVPGFEVTQLSLERDGVAVVGLRSLSEELAVDQLAALRDLLLTKGAAGPEGTTWVRVAVRKPSGSVGYAYVGPGERPERAGDFDDELDAIFSPTMAP